MKRHAFSLSALTTAMVLALGGQAPAIGILVPTDPSLPPLSLSQHTVDVSIVNQVARTRVTQVFHNSVARPLEAHYLFAVPRGAQVTDFVLYINGKPVPAEVMERDKARQIYEDIVRRMRDPGLLEFMDRDLFRVRVFPVPPQGDQKIEIEFAQTLPMDNGAAEYVYPMGMSGAGGRQAGAGDFRLHFSIESQSPIKSVYSPSHRLDLDRDGEKKVSGSISGKESPADRDVTLIYALSGEDVGLNVLAYRPDPKRPGFFLVMVAPKVEFEESDIQPKAVTFVLDTSGSMIDDRKIDQARAALQYCLDSLRPKDCFNIVRFSSDVDSFESQLIPADQDNRKRARRWIEGCRASGGTNIDEGLKVALSAAPPKGFVHTIVLLTDGRPTVGEINPSAILANLKQRNEAELRVFTFGVGNDVNAPLLDQMAEDSRAVSQYVRPGEDMEVAVSKFFDKIASPVLTGLELQVEGVQALDVFPRKMPDLFLGSQLTVFGRYKNPGKASVTLTGNLEGKEKTFEFTAGLPDEDDRYDFIEPLWGQRKVGYLLEEIRRNGESQEVVSEVIDLAKRYGIVTPYTSYLVTDDTEMEQAARQRVVTGPPPQPHDLFYQNAPGRMPAPTPVPGMYGGAGGRAGGGPAVEGTTRVLRSDRMGLAPESPGLAMPEIAGQPLTAAGAPSGRALSSRQSVQAQTGAEAVDASEELRKYKEASVVGRGGQAPEREASGRTFVKQEKLWSDQTIEGRDVVIMVKVMSEAYFEALRIRPDLKAALSLGDEVEIRLDRKTVLRIGPQGKEQLTAADRQILEKTRPASK